MATEPPWPDTARSSALSALFRRSDVVAAPDVKPNDPKRPPHDVRPQLKFVGAVVRAVFMCLLLVVVVRVSSPQNETIWTAYDTPGDLARLALGLAASVWILAHLFILPREPAAYRIWAYLGLVLVPFAIICAVAVW
jgi:hypothetical protein